jgi:putative flippase GtrA
VLLYIFYGALTTVISFAVQIIADHIGLSTWLSTTLSWIFAVTFAFFVNKFFVFDSSDRTAKVILSEAWKFYAARLVSFFIELLYLMLMVDYFGFNLVVNKIIIQIVILISNFLFSKFIIFKKKGE